MDISSFEKHYKNRIPNLAGCHGLYAVLVPLVDVGGEPNLLFEVRASALRRQPGEVCFPGGKVEPGEDSVSCALRETCEELDIPSKEIRVLGQLDFLYHHTGTIIYPILGAVSKKGFSMLQESPSEVAETFLVPFSYFVSNPPLLYHYALVPDVPKDFPYNLIGFDRPYAWKGGRADVPIYSCGNHAVWGLTGRIVMGLVEELGKNG